jgi:aerobic carbon-monoxide dehydrogenase large subunit
MADKGVGETGTIAATAAVINAVVDALAPRGLPTSRCLPRPEKVWRAIEEVKR